MTTIAGLWHRDGSPVPSATIENMLKAQEHRIADEQNYWSDNNVALGHRMRYVTPESLHEKQPLRDDEGQLCLTFHGRIDNRVELRKQIESEGEPIRDDTDAELILKAYKVWQEDSVQRIQGVFAYAIWDQTRQQLFCTRDRMGVKPLVYFADQHRFIFASEIPGVLAAGDVPTRPNEDVVAQYLTSRWISQIDTLYEDIFLLKPAHWMIIQPDRIIEQRYWDIDPNYMLHYKNKSEYTDHLLDLLEQVVLCRMRSAYPVGSQLSGGMDSLTLVAVTQKLIRDGKITDPGFETFSVSYSGFPCDETEGIRKRVQSLDLRASIFDYDQGSYGIQVVDKMLRTHKDVAYDSTTAALTQAFNVAKENGFRVIFSGLGGDDWLSSPPSPPYIHMEDMLALRDFGALAKEFSLESEYYGTQYALRKFGKFALRRFIPKSRLKQRHVNRYAPRFPWVKPALLEKTQVLQRYAEMLLRHDDRFPTRAQKALYNQLLRPMAHGALLTADRFGSLFGIDRDAPLHDIRIVEYGFALPPDQRWHYPDIKMPLRYALQRLLPDYPEHEFTKVLFDSIDDGLMEQIKREKWWFGISGKATNWIDYSLIQNIYESTDEKEYEGYLMYAFILSQWMKHV